MNKKRLNILLCLLLVLSLGAAVYAAAGGFTMRYLPGTSDTVTDLPAEEDGVGGAAYTVSALVPQREGYEFLGWTLDYGLAKTYTLTYQVTGDPVCGKPADADEPAALTGIREGSDVTLEDKLTTAWETADGNPAPTIEDYKVNYLEVGTDKPLAPQKVVTAQPVGKTLTEEAIDIDGYTVVGADTQDLTIRPSVVGQWTFTGWCSDEACTMPITEVTNINADTTVYGRWEYSETPNSNEIIFYYEMIPLPQYVSYTVRYIDIDTGEMLLPDVLRENVELGSTATEFASEIKDYLPIEDPIQLLVDQDGYVIPLLYYQIDQ